jgi:hypothetical protein
VSSFGSRISGKNFFGVSLASVSIVSLYQPEQPFVLPSIELLLLVHNQLHHAEILVRSVLDFASFCSAIFHAAIITAFLVQPNPRFQYLNWCLCVFLASKCGSRADLLGHLDMFCLCVVRYAPALS